MKIDGNFLTLKKQKGFEDNQNIWRIKEITSQRNLSPDIVFRAYTINKKFFDGSFKRNFTLFHPCVPMPYKKLVKDAGMGISLSNKYTDDGQ